MGKRYRKILHIFAAIILVTVFAGSCGRRQPSEQNSSTPSTPVEKIIIGMTQEPDSLDPLFGQMSASSVILGALFTGETVRDQNWERQLRLAEKIPRIEDGDWKVNDDGTMEVLWRIKPGSVWEDGRPLTVFDAIFRHRVVMDDRIPVISRDYDRRIKEMIAEDSYTLRVIWNTKYYLADIGAGFLPAHVLEPVYKRDPSKYHESFFNKRPLGNGAYRIVHWKPGVEILLERNDRYFFDKAKVKYIVFKFIPETNTLLANLLSGTVDAVPPGLGITFDQAVELEKNARKDLNLYFTPGLIWEHIDFNLDNPLFKDKRVRKALVYAINRDEIVEKIFFNKVEVAHSWLPPKHYGYNPDVRKYPYDPETAKRLLKEAGWEWNESEQRFYRDGKPVKISIMTTAGNKLREQVEQVIQSNYREIGIELVIKNQPAKVLFGQTTRYRKFPDLVMYAWIMGPLADGENLWTSDNIPSEKNNWMGQNTPGFRNKEIDKIDHLIPETLSEKERIKLFHREQQIWSEELPSIPLFFRVDVSATRKGFEKWLPTGTTTPITWNAEYWNLRL